MIYVWAAVALCALFFVWQIVRWWNLPATIEARNKAAAERAARREAFRNSRPRLFGRNSPEKKVPPAEEVPSQTLPKPIEIEPSPSPVPREGLRGRIRARRGK